MNRLRNSCKLLLVSGIKLKIKRTSVKNNDTNFKFIVMIHYIKELK